jgi:uncharacterized protein YbbK (DUF523 family)
MPGPVLISACLFGLNTRYDGSSKLSEELLQRLAGRCLVPVCPEQLGGLPTPRPASCFCCGDGADVLGGSARMINTAGEDVTRQFVRGARETLLLAESLDAKEAYFKARSPACGRGEVYIGDTLCEGNGVAAALLLQHGIEVHCED